MSGAKRQAKSTPGTRAAIYTRISKDPLGESTSTARQEKDCRAFAKHEGLQVIEVYTDRDKSAYSGKRRPEFDRLLRDLDRFDVLVVWKLDRLVRQGAQFWKVNERCKEANVRLVSLNDSLDTSTPIGAGVAGLLASVGEQESSNTSTRIRSKQDELAALGQPHGRVRPFGYDRGTKRDQRKTVSTLVIRKDEAQEIRAAVKRIIGGASLRSIGKDWNARGVRPVTAPEWHIPSVKVSLTSPTLAGIRTHNGIEHEGNWKPIISAETRAQLLDALSERRRPRGRNATYALTGMIQCGRCGHTLRSSTGTNGTRRWSCRPDPGGGDRCGGNSAKAELLEQVVVQTFLAAVERREYGRARASAAKRADKNRKDDPEVLRAQLARLAGRLASDELTEDEWDVLADPLRARLRAAEADAAPAEHDDRAWLEFAAQADPRKAWDAAKAGQQREILAGAIERVRLLEATNGGRFDPDRIVIDWRV